MLECEDPKKVRRSLIRAARLSITLQLTMSVLCTGQPWLGNVSKGEIKV